MSVWLVLEHGEVSVCHVHPGFDSDVRLEGTTAAFSGFGMKSTAPESRQAISASGDDIRPGATGKAVPGYVATILVGGLLIAAVAQLTNVMISPPDGDRAAGLGQASVPVSAHRIAHRARCGLPPCRVVAARAVLHDAGDGAAIG